MYNKKQSEILQKLESFIQEQGSQNKASKMLGFSTSTISMIRKGTYEGNIDAIFDKLSEYFGNKELAKQVYSEVEYAETSISSEIYDIIKVCQVKGGFAIACGDAGIGKTKAIKQYLKDNPNNSVMITVNPCISSIKSILKVLAERLGATVERSKDALWLSIANKLRDGMILIFDEAQHLTLQTIEVLRSFSDYLADKGQTLGIIFVGNTETVGRMGSKKAQFAQIINRTKQTKIYSVTEIQRNDIKLLFPLVADCDMEVDFLLKIAQTKQGLRGAVNLFSNAYDNENYTYAGLVAMAKFMDMGENL
ncbi:MAG: AAA family ATPase [Ruminococcus sp.]|nr:AAA family ATPase [Ruminococcus sp.]